jgi:cytochrome c-type biogenesis protein CcmH
MTPTHFLIVLLAVVSVAGSLAFAALLTRPQAPALAPPATGAPPQAGMPDEATILARVETLRERLLADPDDGEGWKLLGRSLFVLGRYSESVMAYSRAAQLLPSDPDVRGALLQLEEKARESNAHEDSNEDKVGK